MRVKALPAAVVAALLAVAVQGFFQVWPPPAYGICIACHGRDLVNGLVNWAFGTRLGVAPVSLAFPLLTTVGVFLGAHLAARLHGEFNRRLVDGVVRSFLLGAANMTAALLALGCTTRLLLRLAYGDLSAAYPLAAAALGIVLGTRSLLGAAARLGRRAGRSAGARKEAS